MAHPVARDEAAVDAEVEEQYDLEDMDRVGRELIERRLSLRLTAREGEARVHAGPPGPVERDGDHLRLRARTEGLEEALQLLEVGNLRVAREDVLQHAD